MTGTLEFHYRTTRRVPGLRPGAHPGSRLGAGQEFVSHMNLYDHPDPRRLDLRASLRSVNGDWLVRVNRQRASIAIYLLVDVSASMRFGAVRTKLEVIAEFVEALSHSAFRSGDALGMMGFDRDFREDLHVPATLGRGVAGLLPQLLRQCKRGGAGAQAGCTGLIEAAQRLAGRSCLVFLASDFHFPLVQLEGALDLLVHAQVVPLIVWDPAEIAPPDGAPLATLGDAESGRQRTLWLRPTTKAAWRAAVAARRQELHALFGTRSLRPFHLDGAFDGEALSQYFLEAVA